MWIPVYPLDVIKSKIQTDKFGKWTGAEDGPKYKNLVDCARY